MTIRHEHRDLTVACDLDSAGLKARSSEWQVLRDTYGLGAEVIAGGARLWLQSGAHPMAVSLVEREAECCGFLDFEMTSHGAKIRLDITSLTPEGAGVAAYLAGTAHGSSFECC